MKKHLLFALIAIAAISSVEARRGRRCGSCPSACEEACPSKCDSCPRRTACGDLGPSCPRSTGPCCQTECYTVYRPHKVERTTCVSEFEACEGCPCVPCEELEPCKELPYQDMSGRGSM